MKAVPSSKASPMIRVVCLTSRSFDPAVGKIPHVAVHTLSGGVVLDKKPEADTLDASTHKEALGDDHGKR